MMGFLSEQRCNWLALRSYLDPALRCRQDLTWLLILTFPNGGSTALAKLLLSAPAATALSDTAEGQWLIPSLSKPGNRWNTLHSVWPRKVRAVWLHQLAGTPATATLVIEKSPPNMCRYRSLLRALHPMQTYLMTFSRDPYATCASWHGRYSLQTIFRDWAPVGHPMPRCQADRFRLLAQLWLDRARMLIRAREHANLSMRYEDFADDPAACACRLGNAVPELRHVTPSAQVQVKDYDPQTITNMNDRQTATLSSEQVSCISSVLAEDRSTVEGLGYSIL